MQCQSENATKCMLKLTSEVLSVPSQISCQFGSWCWLSEIKSFLCNVLLLTTTSGGGRNVTLGLPVYKQIGSFNKFNCMQLEDWWSLKYCCGLGKQLIILDFICKYFDTAEARSGVTTSSNNALKLCVKLNIYSSSSSSSLHLRLRQTFQMTDTFFLNFYCFL